MLDSAVRAGIIKMIRKYRTQLQNVKNADTSNGEKSAYTAFIAIFNLPGLFYPEISS